MSVEVRKNPVRVAVGTTINPAANTAGEQIGAGQLLDWVLKGYVFTGGSVLVDAADIATVSTLADTTPILALESPLGTDIVVVPLRITCCITDDGGGTNSVSVMWTKSRLESAVRLAFTGGTALKISNNYTPNPQAVSQCTLGYTVTSAALTAEESIVLAHAMAADACITTGLIQGNDRFDYSFKNNPIILTEGAALLMDGYSGSSAGKIRPVITWAELPRAAYIA